MSETLDCGRDTPTVHRPRRSAVPYRSASLIVVTFFFFNEPATTEIYTLSLHDALPIRDRVFWRVESALVAREARWVRRVRSEEHTSELQSRLHLVCRLLLEKKKRTRLSGPSPAYICYSVI